MNQINQLSLCLNRSNASRDHRFHDELIVGNLARITFNRTLRIPEDGKTYPLPAGLGTLPIHRATDFSGKVPSSWLTEGSYFIPLHQKEALYLEFKGPNWNPSIAKICIGNVNAISGGNYSERLSAHNQDYVLIPHQRWLDGINAGDGLVRQFVAMPLGSGFSVEAQVTDEETVGGFQLLIIQPKENRFPKYSPLLKEIFEKVKRAQIDADYKINSSVAAVLVLNKEEKQIYFSFLNIEEPVLRFQPAVGHENNFPSDDDNLSMAIAAGGSIKQKIVADTYGVDTWDPDRKRLVTIHMVNSEAYQRITGEKPPPSPISKEDYKYHGIPWYSYYDETSPKLKAANAFRRIIGISAIHRNRGLHDKESDTSIDIKPEIIKQIRTPDATEIIDIYRKRAYASVANSEWKRALLEISNAIDLNISTKASDFALRCYCNYNLGNYYDGEIDASLGLEINPESKDARSLRAYCRLASGDHDGLKEDADLLAATPETAILGMQMRAEAAMLSERYQDAINEALKICQIDVNHVRAQQILTNAQSKLYHE